MNVLSPAVIEARAGLISESDYVQVERKERLRRTKRIRRVVGAYSKLRICGSKQAAIANILADLRHYCDESGLVFEEIDDQGTTLYWEERDLESSYIF